MTPPHEVLEQMQREWEDRQQTGSGRMLGIVLAAWLVIIAGIAGVVVWVVVR